MTGSVLDASALLAFVQDEDGSDVVERELLAGARCGAANWSEIAQKVLAADRDWDLVRALLASYPLAIEPVTAFFDVTDDGTGDYTNVEWTPASFIECSSCQHAGTINDFTTSSPT